MCAFCAMMADGTVHWTEAGTDAGQSGVPESGRERYLGRLRRVSLVNRILDHYGCQASDWANNQYVVRSRAGRTTMVAHLPQVWAAAEEIAGRPLDLSRAHGRPFFFDQGGRLAARFGLRFTPSLVEQAGGRLRITEIPVGDRDVSQPHEED